MLHPFQRGKSPAALEHIAGDVAQHVAFGAVAAKVGDRLVDEHRRLRARAFESEQGQEGLLAARAVLAQLLARDILVAGRVDQVRSEEHTSELQSLMRISYAVFCLKKKNK